MQQTWQEWFEEQKNTGDMKVETQSMTELEQWNFINVEEDGKSHVMFGRPDGEFFRIEGVKVTTSVMSYFQVLMRKLPLGNDRGFAVIAADKNSDRYILQAKKEPGYSADTNYTVIAPPVQMSSSNKRQVHGGAKPPRSEWIEQAQMFPIRQDGGMFRYKINNVGFVELDVDDVELLPTERIFTPEEISEVFEAGLCNDHVIQAIGVYKTFKKK